MAPPDSEAQFKFLIACIKYSTAGKVSDLESIAPYQVLTSHQIDFAQVATECEIVSKGAAYVTPIIAAVHFHTDMTSSIVPRDMSAS